MGQAILQGAITGGPPSSSGAQVPSGTINIALFFPGGSQQFGSSSGTIQKAVNSPSAFTPLSAIGPDGDVPKATLFYLNVTGQLDVQITADDGNGGSTVVVISTQGPLLLIPTASKLITGIAVKGGGQIEYLACGP